MPLPRLHTKQLSSLWNLAAWCYLLLVLVVWQVMGQTGDVWWPGTLILFSPRWFWALPVLLLLPYALLRKRLLLIPLSCTLFIVAIPFMGFNWSSSPGSHAHSGKPLRVVSCNIRGGDFDQKSLELLIKQTAADIAALQECPVNLALTAPAGWSIAQSKGFAVLARFPLSGLAFVTMSPPGETWQQPMLLHTTAKTPEGDIAVCSLHLPTPRFGLQTVFDRKTLVRPSRNKRLLQDTEYRWQAAKRVRDYLIQIKDPLIVAGDFNTPAESQLYQAVWGYYTNAFSDTGRGYGWTQRVRFSGLRYSSRIDHILTNNQLIPLTSAVGPDVGSDHLPLIADIGKVSHER